MHLRRFRKDVIVTERSMSERAHLSAQGSLGASEAAFRFYTKWQSFLPINATVWQ